jgi:hypothetical protein
VLTSAITKTSKIADFFVIFVAFQKGLLSVGKEYRVFCWLDPEALSSGLFAVLLQLDEHLVEVQDRPIFTKSL